MKQLLLISILSALLSCELVVEVDVPGEPSKLVVNSILTPDSTFAIHVAATSYILSNNIPSTQNAVPVLTDENGRQITLVQGVISDPTNRGAWHVNAGGWVYRSAEHPVPGMTYKIEVTAPNFSPVVAIAHMPEAVEITSAKVDSVNAVSEQNYGSAIFPVELTFNDPPGAGDHYYPRMFVEYDYKYFDPARNDTIRGRSHYELYMWKTLVNTDLPDFSEEEDDVIEDASFDGSQYTFRRYVSLPTYSSPYQKPVSLQFVLGRAGPEYHRYFRSKQLQRDTQGNPLAEPVQVFSNVEGGLGIFTGSTNSYWEFIR